MGGRGSDRRLRWLEGVASSRCQADFLTFLTCCFGAPSPLRRKFSRRVCSVSRRACRTSSASSESLRWGLPSGRGVFPNKDVPVWRIHECQMCVCPEVPAASHRPASSSLSSEVHAGAFWNCRPSRRTFSICLCHPPPLHFSFC